MMDYGFTFIPDYPGDPRRERDDPLRRPVDASYLFVDCEGEPFRVWAGYGTAAPFPRSVFITPQGISTEPALNGRQAAELAAILQRFSDTGKIEKLPD